MAKVVMTDDSISVPAPARVQTAVRHQIEMMCKSLDQLLPPEHFARVVVALVKKLDLSEFYADIKAREGHVGRTPVDPAILIALIVLATVEGIGSDRQIVRNCTLHLAYQWICGGVSLNHHLLSDFRSLKPERLERLVVSLVASLLDQDLVQLTRTAQDGMRVRASAGSSSFKKKERLEECLREAQEQVETLSKQALDAAAGEGDDTEDSQTSPSKRRSHAAQESAAAARLQRIEDALEQLPELQERMEKRRKGDGVKARCSTTDADARRMKMADGGTRPAFNVQLATTDDTRIIVGWDVTNAGSDAGLMTPMLEQIEAHYGERPKEHLTDGGFSSNEDIEDVESHGTTVYSPVKAVKNKQKKGIDPFVPQKGDSATIGNWRTRMGTEAAKAIYKLRSSIAEFPNAVFRNCGLRQFRVRGLPKTKSATLWHVLSYDLTRIVSLAWQDRLEVVR
jgi:transposase